MPFEALEARVRDELAKTQHPKTRWIAPRLGPDGREALDVLIVGAGQSGLAVGFGLRRSMVERILLVDKAPQGREGPWRTYARMATLRSPKDMPGPDLGLPSLGYEAWHEARYGRAHWEALSFIARTDWADYLDWFRDQIGLPIENDTEVIDIAPADGLLAATLQSGGARRVVYARKVVLCTGQESTGPWHVPAALADLPAGKLYRTDDPLHAAELAGRDVLVIGAGASAFDNAGTALEAGARSVRVLCRRLDPQVIQPYRWLTFAGFLKHLADMPDEWRWRFMRHVLAMREGFPQMTWDRCARHDAFELVTGADVTASRMEGERVVLETTAGRQAADLVIVCAGIDMAFATRPELARAAPFITTWADRYTPPEAERDARLGAFPYLAPDYAFIAREPAAAAWLADLHLFTIASTLSFGPSGSSLNAMTIAVPRLVDGITRAFFAADLDRHWDSLRAFDIPAAILRMPERHAAE